MSPLLLEHTLWSSSLGKRNHHSRDTGSSSHVGEDKTLTTRSLEEQHKGESHHLWDPATVELLNRLSDLSPSDKRDPAKSPHALFLVKVSMSLPFLDLCDLWDFMGFCSE